jgi:putative sterol carrier protein
MPTESEHAGEFFARIAEEREPSLHDVTATIRLDIERDGTDRPWHLTINRGRVAVSRSDEPADAVMRTDKVLFEQLVIGEANALTAALRGRLRIEGDPRLLMAFKRLLPGPPHRRTSLPSPIDAAPATAATRDEGR